VFDCIQLNVFHLFFCRKEREKRKTVVVRMQAGYSETQSGLQTGFPRYFRHPAFRWTAVGPLTEFAAEAAPTGVAI
jgi:hypothetical protein